MSLHDVHARAVLAVVVVTAMAASPAVAQNLLILPSLDIERPSAVNDLSLTQRSERIECACNMLQCQNLPESGICVTEKGCFWQHAPFGTPYDGLLGLTSVVTFGCLEYTSIKHSCREILEGQEFPKFGRPSYPEPLANAITIFRCCDHKSGCNKDMTMPKNFHKKDAVDERAGNTHTNSFNLVYGERTTKHSENDQGKYKLTRPYIIERNKHPKPSFIHNDLISI